MRVEGGRGCAAGCWPGASPMQLWIGHRRSTMQKAWLPARGLWLHAAREQRPQVEVSEEGE